MHAPDSSKEPTVGSESDSSKGGGDTTNESTVVTNEGIFGADPVTVDRVIELASAAGAWAVKVGETQGKRLMQIARDWMAADGRGDEEIASRDPKLAEDASRKHVEVQQKNRSTSEPPDGVGGGANAAARASSAGKESVPTGSG